MKQYTFKDGFKCVASTKEEAIKKHKAEAAVMDKGLSEKARKLGENAQSFSILIDKISNFLKRIEAKTRRCAWRVADVEATPEVFKYQISVVNNKDEERTYIIEMDNGLLSTVSMSKIEGNKRKPLSSIIHDIEEFVFG